MDALNGSIEEKPKKAKAKASKEYFEKGAKGITDKDVQEVTDRSDEIEDKFQSVGKLSQYWEDAKLMLSLIIDYAKGNYRAVPWFTVAAVVFTLLYILNPLDIIPDFIPFLGYMDDLAILGIGYKLVVKDLHNYRDWKEEEAEYTEEL